MKPFVKYLFLLLAVVILVAVILEINKEHLSDPTKPKTTPAYEDVLPKRFASTDTRRILNTEDAGPLLEPHLTTVRVADAIIEASCESKNPECRLRALHNWVKQRIEHFEVIQIREHIPGPEETLLLREGDDLSISILYGALLRAEGFPSRIGVTPYVTFVETELNGEPIRADFGCTSCGLGTIRYKGPEEHITWVE